ncbi:GGDEF domain-containing protein [Novosphingobium rosa]|uniref:GGDEF domain-containing protein n=1 Tax=Novosphingobium rosa TaxID=76978 RepID=UPI000A02E1B0|nr:GGDEF domain-containing protein [Novosphingobium rosa]
MSVQDPSLPRRPAKGLLDWFGFAGPNDVNHDSEGGNTPIVATTPHQIARKQLMDDITNFLLAHDLEVSGFTLQIAHDYLTGGNRRVIRAIDDQLQAREPITLPLLKKAAEEKGANQNEAMHRLMRRLENDIEDFSKATTQASSATTDYNEALAAHVNDLDKAPDEHLKREELLDLARSMLERTRSLEEDMARSAEQTKALRRSLEEARRNADHDHLTGLPNRRAFEAFFETEHAAAKARGEHLCVAFCDIDHFKRINDTHGHDAGDRVLKVVAETLARISDDRCHVARHGGEEFVVLLRGRSLHEAWEILDDTRHRMAERKLINRATEAAFGQVTFSAGIADVFASEDPRDALAAADKALYKAKESGRNKVVVAEKPTKA